jgi:hypothetical protein
MQIMVAWVEKDDRGVKFGTSAAWTFNGTERDIGDAKTYTESWVGRSKGAVVYVYPYSVAYPHQRAQKDVLAGKPGR